MGDDVWNQVFWTIGGKQHSLNEIEHEVIRTRFKDARIHFALNCASKGCPPIHPQAFWSIDKKGEKLDQVLDHLSNVFVNSGRDTQFRNDRSDAGKIYTSMIMNWFSADFNRDYGSVINFFKKYATVVKPSFFKRIRNSDILYNHYDWTLNEVR